VTRTVVAKDSICPRLCLGGEPTFVDQLQIDIVAPMPDLLAPEQGGLNRLGPQTTDQATPGLKFIVTGGGAIAPIPVIHRSAYPESG
jgi:hypothetical protein